MNDKPKIPRAKALAVANELLAAFAPVCDRIEIAGSLRRGKAEVGDIELLFVPKYAEESDGLFDSKMVDLADALTYRLLKNGVLEKRPNVKGHFTWGEKNKLAIHVVTGIPIDLFSTTSENWWVSLVVRTGSKETNLKLTNGAIKLGGSLVAYGCGVRDRCGIIKPALSERHVFDLCGIPYLEPQQR